MKRFIYIRNGIARDSWKKTEGFNVAYKLYNIVNPSMMYGFEKKIYLKKIKVTQVKNNIT